MDLVKPNILTRMAGYEEDQIEFSILGLVRDPLLDLIGKLAVNVKCLEIVNERLDSNGEIDSESALATTIVENTVLGPDASFGLTKEAIDKAVIPTDQAEEYGTCSVDELLQHRQKLSLAQQELRAAIREEQQSHRADDEYALGRRYDYGPAVRAWVRYLARKKMIQDLV